MRELLIILICSVFSSGMLAQFRPANDDHITITPNYRLHPSGVDQTEVFIVNSPLDQNILFASCNTLTFIPFFISEGVYATIDGGQKWNGSDTCKGEPIAFHGGDPGITIDYNGRFIMTRMGRTPFVGLYSHYSTDNGVTWSVQKAISTDDLERASVKSGISLGSSYPGRTYAAWVKFAYPYPVMFSCTDDGAESWSTQQQINNPSHRSAGGDIAVGPNGEVYLCWAGVTETSPFKEILAGFASSNDGGENWSVNEEAFLMNGITGVLENKENIRVNGLPRIAVDLSDGPGHGWIYIVTGEKELAPAGDDPDIILHRSEDGGLSWSDAIRVNQDEVNNGMTQYFPAIHIDRTGAVNILFYDDRNTSSDSVCVILARSTDNGDTWTEREISDHRCKPEPIGGLGQGYQGDNIDLTSTDTHLWPVWMDNSTGVYQIWTAPVSFSDLNGVVEKPEMSSHNILNISPNPTRGDVKITIKANGFKHLRIKVFDNSGKELCGIFSEMSSQDLFSTSLDMAALGLSTGLYLILVETDTQNISTKLLYLTE